MCEGFGTAFLAFPKTSLLPCREGKEEVKNNSQMYTTQQGIRQIKYNPPVYNSQEDIEEIKSNPQVLRD